METDAQIIINTLGSRALAAALRLSVSSIKAARAAGVMPSSWMPIVRDLCAACGIDCPESAFKWRTRG